MCPERSHRLTTRSEDETRLLGERLSAGLQPGDIVLLSGPLGSGKTRLAQGIARGLGVTGRVTSPTFVLVNSYQGRIPFFHADLYRLADVDTADLGLEEAAAEGVLVIEWPEQAAGIWQGEILRIEFSPGDSEAARTIQLSTASTRLAQTAQQVATP